MVESAWPTRQAVFRQARQDLGLDLVEVHEATVRCDDPHDVADLKSMLRWYKLACSALVCAPDLTNPNVEVREGSIGRTRSALAMGPTIGCALVRVGAGPQHPGQNASEALGLAEAGLLSLQEEARGLGLRMVLENQMKDPLWSSSDLCHDPGTYLALHARLSGAGMGASFNCSTSLATFSDSSDLLDALGSVDLVHVSDRLPGLPDQTVLGEGMADLEGLLQALAARGYSGVLTYEDGNPQGNRGTRRSIDHLRALVARYWPEG
jgi:sugar phosphate isomerase/epimerase